MLESRRRAGRELDKAKEEIAELEVENEKIKEEVALSGLNEMQVHLVHENAHDIEANVEPRKSGGEGGRKKSFISQRVRGCKLTHKTTFALAT